MMAEDKSVQQMQAIGARLVQSSPGLAEKLVANSRAQMSKTPLSRDDRDAIIADLQRQLETEKDRGRSLEDQYKYRIASFVKRETQTKNKIESLERRMNDGPETDEHFQRMAVIDNMHHSVMAGLECIQSNTAKIMQDQEKDLMRAFRARLQEVSKDLEAQRSRKGEHSSELQVRHRRVVAELHEAQELAQTFDKKNQQLQAENQKLQEKLRTREDDRQALLRELVLSRKEAARLKAQLKDGPGGATAGQDGPPGASQSATDGISPQGNRRSFSQRQMDQVRLQQTHNKQYEREVAYREAVTKLKRMVETERKTVRSLRQQQAELLQQRTELEVLLRQCLDDVKAEILRHRLSGTGRTEGPDMLTPAQPVSTMSVHELSAQDRERVLELLLSQQRVVQLLYSKSFPQQLPSLPPLGDDLSKAGKDDDFAWLSDIIPGDA